jgi:hypothetical protein
MDYYLADRHFLPPGRFDRHFTEKIVYLPANVPFQPFQAAPPVNSLPALASGALCIGSFNRMGKINPATIDMWSGLLTAVPDARMLIGAVDGGGRLLLSRGCERSGHDTSLRFRASPAACHRGEATTDTLAAAPGRARRNGSARVRSHTTGPRPDDSSRLTRRTQRGDHGGAGRSYGAGSTRGVLTADAELEIVHENHVPLHLGTPGRLTLPVGQHVAAAYSLGEGEPVELITGSDGRTVARGELTQRPIGLGGAVVTEQRLLDGDDIGTPGCRNRGQKGAPQRR